MPWRWPAGSRCNRRPAWTTRSSETLTAAFPEASARDLQDAGAELEMHGLASVSKAIGHPLLRITPSYALFDPVAQGTSPQFDAVEIAKAALEMDSGRAPELEVHLGWPRRRFNPAFALPLTFMADGRIRKVIQPDYPSLGVMWALRSGCGTRR